MLIENKSKLDVTVCGQKIEKGGVKEIDEEIWLKEYNSNQSLKDSVSRKKLVVSKSKNKLLKK
jgi:hypothetical protein